MSLKSQTIITGIATRSVGQIVSSYLIAMTGESEQIASSYLHVDAGMLTDCFVPRNDGGRAIRHNPCNPS